MDAVASGRSKTSAPGPATTTPPLGTAVTLRWWAGAAAIAPLAGYRQESYWRQLRQSGSRTVPN